MNPIDDQLNRLFRAARQTDRPEMPVPFGLETRALAAWREGRHSVAFWDMSVLVRGLAVAVLIAGASMWPVLNKASTTTTDPLSEYAQVSDTSLASDETP